MNDIEVLEDYINRYDIQDLDNEGIEFKNALENLLKERQSDKERIKDLTLNEKEKEIIETYRNLIKETGLESWIICNPETMWSNYFIPKSLIKEKIEEYKEELERDKICIDFAIEHEKDIELIAKIQVLEELLKGE